MKWKGLAFCLLSPCIIRWVDAYMMEFSGYKRPEDYSSEREKKEYQKQVQILAASIKTIFLRERKTVLHK